MTRASQLPPRCRADHRRFILLFTVANCACGLATPRRGTSTGPLPADASGATDAENDAPAESAAALATDPGVAADADVDASLAASDAEACKPAPEPAGSSVPPLLDCQAVVPCPACDVPCQATASVSSACDDGSPCTTSDSCIGGKCVGGPPAWWSRPLWEGSDCEAEVVGSESGVAVLQACEVPEDLG